jgi:tripartite-type tricarboxylate transporter receptor subunit TctC
MTDLIAGQIDLMVDQVQTSSGQIRAGTIKAYAIATAERNPALPDLPTTKEAGLPAFEASAWNALFAPKGTPKPIVDKLSAALDKALDDEAVRKRGARCVGEERGRQVGQGDQGGGRRSELTRAPATLR